MDPQQTLHRRKSSKESDTAPNGIAPAAVAFPTQRPVPPPPPSPRSRVQSTPVGHTRSISSALVNHPTSPFNQSFSFGAAPQPNGAHGPSASLTYRPSFQLGPTPRGHGHARKRSISAFAPSSPSPLSSSFPLSASANDTMPISPTTATSRPTVHLHPFPTSNSAPENSSSASFSLSLAPPLSPTHNRRHSRVHSRNLSVFFPRPGTLPHSAIAEDGTHELELGLRGEQGEGDAPVSDVPAAGVNGSWRSKHRTSSSSRQPPSPIGVGFTFGGRPPSLANGNGPPLMAPSLSSSSTSSISSRRGHHHKHSLSHNFFSFLEPRANGAREELHTHPTPSPVSPWAKTHALPDVDQPVLSLRKSVSPSPSPVETIPPLQPSVAPAIGVGLCNFLLGSSLWVVGQRVGSLASTGLGYWIVFDAFGVAIGKVVPRWLNAKTQKGVTEKVRRPYGNARVETVLMFVQSVYLLFSAVYVCKETVEHVLLSAGDMGGEKHHHHFHASDESGVSGIDFPIGLVFISFIFIICAALFNNHHAKLVNVTDNRIPSLSTLIRSLLSGTKRIYHEPSPATQPALMLSNPYILSPLLFCIAILLLALCVPPSQHEACDMILAAIIAVVTFNVAYRACTVLGTVLLQTAPPRGLPGGKMEAFLRVMRELERHPQVLHLPAPHIWQLTPSTTIPDTGLCDNRNKDGSGGGRKADPLIVTIELHVKPDLGDDDVLNLTRWTWERCMLALGGDVRRDEKWKSGEGPEVTIGVVRG